MVLPLTLLRAGKSQPTLIELKNGETYSGILDSCDAFMNMHMVNVVCTSKSGTDFWKLDECFIRGNTVKSLRLPNEVAEIAKEEKRPQRPQGHTYSGRGRGRGDGGGMRGRGHMYHNPRR
ncbi:putative U6 snRNA-associated Sm-like protein LSm4 [Theileria parva strain Muguga]|uniref:putative U6 snRNA-associated Sm-like protein LSm4 n=1 Tax=Theileria parva strain Muguga TaxID=333668 RepID=UPI001C61DFF1|nr:putative U6 snRNA-associated Sm-like protein LSm4 [Theileria parva strain Muguga]EAN31261.2 putative U6 snRNA-associated Sm-like protein LSm4 [Theileria parva strain Muguga]